MMTNKISMDKKYTTRSGLPVRILCVDRKDSYGHCEMQMPVVGLILKEGDHEEISRWTEYGSSDAIHLDLVEVKEKKKAYLICNITKGGYLDVEESHYDFHGAELSLLGYRKECPGQKFFIHEIEYEA